MFLKGSVSGVINSYQAASESLARWTWIEQQPAYKIMLLINISTAMKTSNKVQNQILIYIIKKITEWLTLYE